MPLKLQPRQTWLVCWAIQSRAFTTILGRADLWNEENYGKQSIVRCTMPFWQAVFEGFK